jgi:hypothetical protein
LEAAYTLAIEKLHREHPETADESVFFAVNDPDEASVENSQGNSGT